MENYAITGRGARVKHLLDAEGVALCGQAKAPRPAVGRFEKLPVHGERAKLAADDVVRKVRLSNRVAAFLATDLAETAPRVVEALQSRSRVRNGRGYTVFITAPTRVINDLVDHMKALSEALGAGTRTTRGMGFRKEAVDKGLEHIRAGLMV